MINKNGVCLVGLAPTNYIPRYKIWTLNEGLNLYPDAKMVFQIHNIEYLKSYKNRFTNNNHYEELISYKIPIAMQDDYDGIEMSFKLPIEEIIQEFKFKLFNSTLDYMIAYAIYKGYKNIDILGVDMSTISEYSKQKYSLLFWFGMAKSKGIKISIKSNYFWNENDKKLYGYEV